MFTYFEVLVARRVFPGFVSRVGKSKGSLVYITTTTLRPQNRMSARMDGNDKRERHNLLRTPLPSHPEFRAQTVELSHFPLMRMLGSPLLFTACSLYFFSCAVPLRRVFGQKSDRCNRQDFSRGRGPHETPPPSSEAAAGKVEADIPP